MYESGWLPDLIMTNIQSLPLLDQCHLSSFCVLKCEYPPVLTQTHTISLSQMVDTRSKINHVSNKTLQSSLTAGACLGAYDGEKGRAPLGKEGWIACLAR